VLGNVTGERKKCYNAIMRECKNGRRGIQGNWKKNWQISNLRLQISNKYQIQKFEPVLQVEYLGFEQLRFICFLLIVL